MGDSELAHYWHWASNNLRLPQCLQVATMTFSNKDGRVEGVLSVEDSSMKVDD